MSKKYLKIILSLIWLPVFMYSVYLFLYTISDNSKYVCDSGNTCLQIALVPFVLPSILYLIWKPENKTWGRQILHAVLLAPILFIVVFGLGNLF